VPQKLLKVVRPSAGRIDGAVVTIGSSAVTKRYQTGPVKRIKIYDKDEVTWHFLSYPRGKLHRTNRLGYIKKRGYFTRAG